MDRLRTGLDRLMEVVFGWLPSLVGALVILLIGYIVAKAIAKVIRRALMRVQLDARLHAGHGGNVIQRAVPRPTDLISKIVYWLIFLGALSLAITVLGIDSLNRFVAAIYSYVPSVIAAILIFLVASAIAAGVVTLVQNVMGDTPIGKILETIAPVIVMGIAIFMILDQLKIASTIVTITYAALIGSVALGSALAFGLGGRDVASQMLGQAYDASRRNADQVKRDVAVGKDRAKDKAQDAARRNRH